MRWCSVVVLAGLCLTASAFPASSDNDDLDVSGPVDMNSSQSSVDEMNAQGTSTLMPSSTSGVDMKEPSNANAPASAFANMEGEQDTFMPSVKSTQSSKKAASKVSAKTAPNALQAMNGNDASPLASSAQEEIAPQGNVKGKEVDLSMPGSSPVAKAQNLKMVHEGEDEFVATEDMQAKMLSHAIEPGTASANAEESKMNEVTGDAPLSAEDEAKQAKAALSASEDRMNVDAPEAPEVTSAAVLVSTVSTMQENTPSPAGDEDDRDLAAAMDSNEMNAPAKPNEAMMMAPTSVASAGEPSAFDTMNALKSVSQVQAVKQAPIATAPPSTVKLTPVAKPATQAPSSVAQKHVASGEEDVKSPLSAHEMESAAGDHSMQEPSAPATMPSVTKAHMGEPEPDFPQQAPAPAQQHTMATPAAENDKMNAAVGSVAMPSVTSSNEMWEPNSATREADVSGMVMQSTNEAMPNDVPMATMSSPAQVEEQYSVPSAFAEQSQPTKAAEKQSTVVTKQAFPADDGAMMGDMSKVPTAEVKTSSSAKAGFMDADETDGSFASQMNTVSTGLNMMSTVPASFLLLSETEPEPQPASRPTAPFYNQYTAQGGQPQPIPSVAGAIPLPTHPYGLPYFRRDPFMPLQTPYYHIPAFDNPQKNPALTPYYNPFVNPPPPVPPSVPAAPSFFPFHHHQHMIPPYFPYPPPPVLQPGPFPPYALPSYIAPGQMAPDAKTAKLPKASTEDPF